MKGTTMATGKAKAPNKAVAVRRTPEQTMAVFSELVTMVPEMESSGIESIIDQIMNAETMEDLNMDEGLPSSKDLVNQMIRVDAVYRRASDNPSRTGFYLICDGTLAEGGGQVRFTAGGEQAVAVLSKLCVMEKFPAVIQFVAVPVKSGFEAINCQVKAWTDAA